jgi:carbamoyltransferase
MNLLGIHNGHHDASACLFRDYELLAAVSLERLTRKKNDGVTPQLEVPAAAIAECLSIGNLSPADIDMVCASRAHFDLQSYRLRGRWWIKQQYYGLIGARRNPLMSDLMLKQRTLDAASIFDKEAFRRRYGFGKADIYFYNHHAAHGLPAYFFSEFGDALIYTADGIGDNVSYSVTAARGGKLEVLAGDDRALHQPFQINSIGLLYCYFTDALGFIWNRHEGKLTGLAGFGKPIAADDIMRHFTVDATGAITSDFPSYPAMHEFARDVCMRLLREDAAASVQEATERLLCDSIGKYLRRTGLENVAVSGGVFANVRLNRAILETTPARRVFVFPAMGDEGLPVGGCLLYLHERDGAEPWQGRRYPLRSLYLGRDYGTEFDAAAKRFAGIMVDGERPVEKAVELLARGAVVGIYTNRMEFGPRAVGVGRSSCERVRHQPRQRSRGPVHDHHVRRTPGVAATNPGCCSCGRLRAAANHPARRQPALL